MMNFLKTLYEAYHSALKKLQTQKAQPPAGRPKPRRFVTLSLERLEDRLTPVTVDTWVGGFSSDWNTPGNWQTEQNGKVVAAAVPVLTTDVIIPALAAGCVAPVIGANGNLAAVCGSLINQTVTPLTINAGSSLDVTGQGSGNSGWGLNANAPTLTVNGIFQIDGLGPNSTFDWLNGNITGTGTAYVANGAQFNVVANASNLGVSLNVGEDGINDTNQTAISTFNLSSVTGHPLPQ